MLSNMNITVKALLEATTAAITNYETAKTDYDAAAKIWVRRNLASKRQKALDQQRTVRDALSAAIRSKKPLTIEQFREAAGERSDYFSHIAAPSKPDAPSTFLLDGVRFERPRVVPLADLKALEVTLSNVTEEVISDGQLQRLGFKNMGWVFRAVVNNQ